MADRSGQLDGLTEILFRRSDVPDLPVQGPFVAQRFSQLTLQSGSFVDFQRLAILLECRGVLAFVGECTALAFVPVRFLFLEASLPGQLKRALEVAKRFLYVSQPQVAKSKIAQVLAFGSLGLQLPADL